MTEGTITKWLKQPGDSVAKYEPLCEVATDKVNAEVPATMSGTVTEIVTEEGKTVEVGEIICRIQKKEKKRRPPPLRKRRKTGSGTICGRRR